MNEVALRLAIDNLRFAQGDQNVIKEKTLKLKLKLRELMTRERRKMT